MTLNDTTSSFLGTLKLNDQYILVSCWTGGDANTHGMVCLDAQITPDTFVTRNGLSSKNETVLGLFQVCKFISFSLFCC